MSRERESRETARQNSPTQKGTESNLTDVERVEDAARAIARAIEDASDDFWNAQVEATKPKNRLVSSMLFVASTWVIFFAIFSGLTLLVGVALYNVGPFHALERIGREQQQVEAKKDLSELRIDSGNSLLNVGEAKAAKEEFEAALELDPFSQEAQEGRMKSELFEAIEAEEYDLAVIRPKLDTLAEERKKVSHVYAFRGTVHFYAQPDKALEQYKKAVSLDPNSGIHKY
jgi:tetratricopeptide (TPR) repeat protein